MKLSVYSISLLFFCIGRNRSSIYSYSLYTTYNLKDYFNGYSIRSSARNEVLGSSYTNNAIDVRNNNKRSGCIYIFQEFFSFLTSISRASAIQ